ncbi:MAG: Ig-like domain-containing protein [Pyrinomonadaceae bacterium]
MKRTTKRLYIIFSLIILCLAGGGRLATMQKSEVDSLILPTPAPAAGAQQQPGISKGANSTLVVWSDNRTSITRAPEYSSDGQGGSFDIYAARMDAGGNLIDTAPIVVSEALYDQIYPSVAWNGQNWLVAWRTPRLNDQYKTDVLGVRISPDGAILDAAPIVIGTDEVSGDTNYLSVASDGVNWVVTWGGGYYESQIRAARIANNGAVIDAGGGGKVLFDDTDLFTAPSNAKFAFANNQFLLVWVRLVSGGYGIRGQRFDRNLNPIDAAPFQINFVQGSDATSAQVATDGTDFFVIWRDDRYAYNEIYGTRVSAAGQVLDPNGILLSGINTNYTQQGSTALCFDGVNYIAAYHTRQNGFNESIHASRIAPNGTLLTPNPIVVSNSESLQPAIAPLASGVSQIVWTDSNLSAEITSGLFFGNSDIFGARILADGTASAPAPVSLGAPRETQPHLVFTTGGNFTTVFRSATSGATNILLQRFDANGNAIDANPIAVKSGAEGIKNPSVAWNGTDYLVVWELNTQIYGRRVASDGSLLGSEFAIMPGNQPDVAALGTQFLVVDDYEPTNHIRFAQSVRVDAGGTVLGSPLKIGSNYDLRPRVRAFGSRWLAIWESDITHDNPNSNTQAAFVNPDGTSPGEFAVSGSSADTPAFAVAGDTALIVWAGAQGKIYGRRMKSDGTLLDTAGGIVLASAPKPLYAPSAAWDGSRFIVAYNDSRNRSLEPPDDVWATLVGLDGAILTPGGFPVSKLSTPEEHPVVEAQNGKTIFGYALFDDKAPYSNYRIKLRKFPFEQDYSIAVTPYLRQAAPGAVATYQVGISAAGGFNGQINLGIDGLPNGVTATFNPPAVTGSGTSVLTISTASDTPENIYRFTVTATSGAQQSNAEIVLYLDDSPPPTGFTVSNLGTLGGTESAASAVNNNGQVVGYSFNASQKRRAFLYSNGQMTDLGTLGGLESEARDINDSGVIVGQAKNAAAKNRAFVYNGTMHDLGTFGGDEAFASGINNSNRITGAATVNEGLYHAFRSENNQLQDLGIMGGYYSYGFGINSAGKVVGYGYVDGIEGGVRGFIYQNSMSPLGTVGGRDSSATAINDSDQIVGSSTYLQNSGTQHAFLYSGGQMIDLGTLGAAQSFAKDINNSGQVVGSLELTLFGRDYRAFFYDGTTMRNLNTLIPQDSGWILNEALGISNNGQIVGRGTINSQSRAFLLTPVGSQNTPPTVEITSPTTNRNFAEATAITINASAFDADGTVVKVEFYADGNLIGTSTSNPFAILWTGMAQNHTYTLTAKATDDRGAITVSAPVTITVGTSQQIRQTPFDFDGDAKTDVSIYRPAAGEWWYLRSSDGGNYAAQFGASSDRLVPGDYTGDGKTDIAIWRPVSGEWFILRSENGSYYSFPFGITGDVPAPADFDGDGKTDAAIFRPSDSTWYINKSSGGTTIQRFGQAGDVPVTADYDGDNKADIAIYRPSAGEWWIQRSAAGLIAFQFGNSSDKPVQGDYTGDGKVDVAIWRPSTGEWFILRSENYSYYSFPFGINTDIPAPGDYDGDGKFDATVFRPSNSTWYVQRSTAGTLIQNFGISGDKPVPNAFVP